MAILRWYDKDRYLSAFMTLLETLPEEVQSAAAADILGELPKIISRDYETFMAYVEKNDPKKFNRWYDKNPNLHKVTEAIRQLQENEREALYIAISDIMQKYTEIDLTGLKTKK